MVVVGADVHKRTHTFVAVDAVGGQVGQVTVAAVTEGHLKALAWAREQFGDDLVWDFPQEARMYHSGSIRRF